MFKRMMVCILAIGILTCSVFACAVSENRDIKKVFDDFSEGMVRYKDSKGKVGFLDTEDNIVIKAKFISAEGFHNGLAAVQVAKNKYAVSQFIDKTGKVVIDSIDTSSRMYGFDDWMGDYAIVEIWRKNKDRTIDPIGYQYINENGKLLNQEEYMSVREFKEGYARVGILSGTPGKKYTRMTRGTERWLTCSPEPVLLYSFIDKQGQSLGNMSWSDARDFSDGMAAVAIKGANGDNVWGFIDASGEMAVPPQWVAVSDFRNGYASAYDGKVYRFIDKTGRQAVPGEWEATGSFSTEGYAVVKTDGECNIIDREGQFVFEENYLYIYPTGNPDRFIVNNGFAEGIISLSGETTLPFAFSNIVSSRKWVYAVPYRVAMIVNESGKIVSPVFINGKGVEDPDIVPEGMPVYKMKFQDNALGMEQYGMVDEDKRLLSMFKYTHIEGETFKVTYSPDAEGVYTLDGEKLMAGEHLTDFKVVSDDVLGVCRNNLWGLMDRQGQFVVQPAYSSLTPFTDGMTMATMGSKREFFDEKGRKILPVIDKKSNRDQIKQLQQDLQQLGYYNGKINGEYNRNVSEAISAAQLALGCEQSGVADSAFQYAVREAVDNPEVNTERMEAGDETKEKKDIEPAKERQTKEELSSYRELRIGDSGEDVLRIKERLYELGYMKTRQESSQLKELNMEPIHEFERRNGLPQGNTITQEVQSRLFSQDAIANK